MIDRQEQNSCTPVYRDMKCVRKENTHGIKLVELCLLNEKRLGINLVPRSHSVTGNVRSGKVRQYTIFHCLLKKGCGNAIYAPIGLFRGALSEGLVFASSCAVLNKCQLCGGKSCFFRRWKSFTAEENHFKNLRRFCKW